MAVSKHFRSHAFRWLCLLPIPILWCLAAHHGWLQVFEETTLDWRYRSRGELKTSSKVVYVDIDSESIGLIGNWPWSREYFASVCETLLTKAGVKAIGIDLVMSDVAQAELADQKRLLEGNQKFASLLLADPPIVMGATFQADIFRDDRNEERTRRIPLVIGESRKPEDLEPPEMARFDRIIRGRKVPFTPSLNGLIDTVGKSNRWVVAWAPTVVRPYYHMAVELARLVYGLGPNGVKVQGDELLFVAADGTVLQRIPLTKQQFVEVNWHTSWKSELSLHEPFSSVLSNELVLSDPEATAEEKRKAASYFANPIWKNAVVLIGPVDRLLQDLGPAPFDKGLVPKVGVHGNLLKTILSGNYLHRPPQWWNMPVVEFAAIFGLTILVTATALAGGSRQLGWLFKVLAVGLAALYVGAAFLSFAKLHWVMPLTAPLGSAFTTSFAGLLWQVLEEQRQKSRIKGMFSTYLAPTVVNDLIASGKEPELGGHDAEITPYFSDIQSFSSFSEVMGSSKLGELLNEYLSACTDIVQSQGGTLDKYIGDAVVAMFGAPVEVKDHALRACVTSQLVQARIAELRVKWKSEGGKWPDLVHNLQTRIGLNTGLSMIGNMGSATRFNYTMMGDNVNLAARMESGAKSWGVYTMCTETTRAACEAHDPGRIVFRPLGRIVVKGRSQAVPIFEIVGLRENVKDGALDCVDHFNRAMSRMYARDWDGALALFRKSAALEPNQPGVTPGVKTNASLVRIEKVEHYKAEPPPPNWDGVEVMTEK